MSMAKDRRYSSGANGPSSGVHLFDFNETLAARRLLEDKRIAIETQFHRGRPTVDAPRHSSARREDVEMIRNALRSTDKKNVPKELKALEKPKAPTNVVARLMGLETLPTQPMAAVVSPVQISKKKKSGEIIFDKQERPVFDKQQSRKQSSSPSSQIKEQARYRPQDPREQDVFELQEMERQLAVKQMLVREKLNEAKRLLTHDKLDSKWTSANEKINQSKQFLDAVEYFQSNRDTYIYLDEQDAVLPGRPQLHDSSRVPPEGMGNPIVRRVIEERRNDELKLFLTRQADMKKMREQTPPKPSPTRIVVLKPSPSRNVPSRPVASLSPRSYSDVKDLIEAARPQVPMKKSDIPKDEGAANPREIAKEIARQVRENVIRELARSEEHTTDKRIDNIPKAGFSSDYSRAGTPTDVIMDDNLPKRASPENTRNKSSKLKARVPLLDQVPTEDFSRKPVQSAPKKNIRVPRPTSPQPSASKGIVVLVPDGSRSPEVQIRGETMAENRKQPSKKDTRGRRSPQPVYKKQPDEPVKPEPEEFRVEEPECRIQEVSVQEVGQCRIQEEDEECRTQESTNYPDQIDGFSSETTLGYGGSFLLRSASNVETFNDIRTVEEYPGTDYGNHRRTQSESGVFFPIESNESLRCEPDLTNTDDSDRISDLLPSAQESSEASVPSKVCSANTDQPSPSPVSVLDSSFEESPSRVMDYQTISSDLEELRLHLSRLQWDPRDQEDDATSDKMLVVDKVVVEESEPQLQRISCDEPDSSTGFDWLEWECFQTDDLPCPEGAEEDLIYVKMVLLASGLISSVNRNHRVHLSPSEALDSSVFDKLEEYYSNSKVYRGARCRRRLMFDLVNEIIGDRFQRGHAARSKVPPGNFLLTDVWTKICEYSDCPKGEDDQATVELLLEKYMTTGGKWIDLEAHCEAIAKQIESKIFRELLDETVKCITGLA